VSVFCKVLIDSPLPQLGREFDYKVPGEFELEVGQPVLVPFGRQSKLRTAVVTEISSRSDLASAELAEVLGPPVMSQEFIDYLKAVARRQAISPGELIRLSLTVPPKRRGDFLDEGKSVPVWVVESLGGTFKMQKHLAEIVTPKQRLFSGKLHPQWALSALRSALSVSGSAIINTPDHRYQARLRQLLEHLDIADSFYWAEDYKTPARRYWLQQRLLRNGGILIGSRAVLMMDIKNLERIIVINDLDPSHESDSSPYLATRELAIIRSEAQKCLLHFVSHTPSAEIIRLSELGFFEITNATETPRISFGSEEQLNTSKLITEAIKQGPVLIMTSFSGDSAAISCKVCRASGRCQQCGGSIHMPTAETYRCRTCEGMEKPVCVSCGGHEFIRGRKGATRTSADFGKIIPGVRVIESSQAKHVEEISQNALVVATPGAIPLAKDGYQLVVIDQAQSFLSRESLRALEHSLRIWFDAASHLAINGQMHFASYQGDVVKKISIGQGFELVQLETQQRKNLGLSPWRRLGIVEGESSRLNQIADTISMTKVISTHPRLVFTYQYRDGANVAEILLREQLATPPIEGKRRKRGLRVIMDGQSLI
jgi:primosomal protein N' (replication factor Y)